MYINILYYKIIDNNYDITDIINNISNNYLIIINNKNNYNINKLIDKLPNDFDNFADITNNNLSLLYNTKYLKLISFISNEKYQLFMFNNFIIINMLDFISDIFINILLKINNINNYRVIIISNFCKKKSKKINLCLHKFYNFKLINNIYDKIYDSNDNIILYKILNENLFIKLLN